MPHGTWLSQHILKPLALHVHIEHLKTPPTHWLQWGSKIPLKTTDTNHSLAITVCLETTLSEWT